MALTSEATISLSLIAKDLASSNIQKVALGLDGLKTKGSLAGAALKGAGVVAGGGFALMTAGALQAEGAQGKFMAATGKSRDEAKAFVSGMDSLAGSAGTVGRSFEDIAATGTMVEQQFGTTGKATTDLTEHVLEYSKVVGGDAADNTAHLEDTLSSYGLGAQDAAGFTDMLVASSQKFGTDAGPQQLAILQSLAPAVQHLGGDVSDASALLNAFEVAGVDAGQAQKDLNAAISKLPDGTTLNGLITQLGAIQDPAERSQKAVELLGTKAGLGLAKVIQPGMTSLDDFKVSAQDAAGATGKAADDMLTFGDRIRGFADKAIAGAREIGQQFGPAITGLASLGSLAAPFAKGLGGLLVDVAKSVLPQATATGLATGAAMAEGEAEGAGGASAISKIGARIGAMGIPLAAEGTTVGTAVGSAMTLGVLAGWFAAGTAVIELPAILDHLAGQDTTSKLAGIGKYWADTTLESMSEEAKTGAGKAFQAAWEAARASGADADAAALAGKAAADKYLNSSVSTLADEMKSHATWAPISAAMEAAGEEVGAAGGETAVSSWQTAMSEAAKRNKNSMTLWDIELIKEKARNDAAAAAHEFALGWQDGVPSIHQQWKDFVKSMDHALDPTTEMAWLHGKLTSKRLADGLASNDPIIRARAQNEQSILQKEWDGLYALGYRYGEDAGQGVAAGVRDTSSKASAAAAALARQVNAALSKIVSGIQVHVGINGDQWAHGVRIPTFAKGGHIPANQLSIIGEEGPELWKPDTAGTVIPRGSSGAALGLSGAQINLSFPSLIPYSGAQMAQAARDFIPELVREMRRQRLLPQGGF